MRAGEERRRGGRQRPALISFQLCRRFASNDRRLGAPGGPLRQKPPPCSRSAIGRCRTSRQDELKRDGRRKAAVRRCCAGLRLSESSSWAGVCRKDVKIKSTLPALLCPTYRQWIQRLSGMSPRVKET